MNEWYPICSLGFVTIGIFTFIVMLGISQNLKESLPYALDFWMGAGFLKLICNPSWHVVLAVASIVLVRKMISFRF